jgi:ribosomal protein S18 acetylase RimI-like enzyme
MIRKATHQDIDSILEITKACASHMKSQNIFQWNEYYPNKKAFTNDVEKNELYVLERNNQIIGNITISIYMDEEYIPVTWQTPNKNNIYIHRLAVHPNHQGKGYAQQLMQFAENYSKENNYTSVRLDTFSQNERNQKFYELRGYKKLEAIYFPKQSEYPFYCYELVF